MNTKHTPEPWTWTTHGTQPGTDFKQVQNDDYKRAMECVNAMEGIYDPQLYINVCKELDDKLQKWSAIVQRSVDIIKTKNSHIVAFADTIKKTLSHLPLSSETQKAQMKEMLKDLDEIIETIQEEQPLL